MGGYPSDLFCDVRNKSELNMIGVQVFKGIDSNQDGLIQYDEFMTGVMSTLREFSSRGNGFIRDADKDGVQNTVTTVCLIERLSDCVAALLSAQLISVVAGGWLRRLAARAE